jgi:hypothetical protein
MRARNSELARIVLPGTVSDAFAQEPRGSPSSLLIGEIRRSRYRPGSWRRRRPRRDFSSPWWVVVRRRRRLLWCRRCRWCARCRRCHRCRRWWTSSGGLRESHAGELRRNPDRCARSDSSSEGGACEVPPSQVGIVFVLACLARHGWKTSWTFVAPPAPWMVPPSATQIPPLQIAAWMPWRAVGIGARERHVFVAVL